MAATFVGGKSAFWHLMADSSMMRAGTADLAKICILQAALSAGTTWALSGGPSTQGAAASSAAALAMNTGTTGTGLGMVYSAGTAPATGAHTLA